MYCTQCGKQIRDDSKFCYNCGTQIILPDVAKPEAAPGNTAPRKTKTATKTEKAEPKKKLVEIVDKESLPVDTKSWDSMSGKTEKTIQRQTEKPVQKQTEMPVQDTRTVSGAARFSSVYAAQQADIEEPVYRSHISGDTPIPRVAEKKRGSEDVWSRPRKAAPVPVDDEEDEYDRFQREDNARYGEYGSPDSDYDLDDDYEDEESASFLVRHARGIIVLLLIIALVLAGAIWLLSANGQVLLAKYDLAWDASAYRIAAEASFNDQAYLEAGSLYEKAYAKTTPDYALVYNTAMSYQMGGDTEKATKYIREAIGMAPDKSDPYILLQKLYPDANTRPAEITNILQDGFQRTGDPAILGR